MVDNRNGGQERPRFANYSDADIGKMSYLEMFLVLFLFDFLRNTIVQATNKKLSKIGKCDINVGELLIYFEITISIVTWLMTITTTGTTPRSLKKHGEHIDGLFAFFHSFWLETRLLPF